MKGPRKKAVSPNLFGREARLVKSHAIGIERSSIRRQDRDGLGIGIGDLAQIRLILPQPVFGPLPVIDVGIDSIPSDDVALLIVHRYSADQEPAIFSVEAP
jgi:hypothetical protein